MNEDLVSRMQRYSFENMDVYVADNHNFPKTSLELEQFKYRFLAYLNPKNLIKIQKNSSRNGLAGIVALLAHGADYRGEWVYDDSDRLHKVQDFIDMNDGKYGLIMLFCTQEGHSKVTSKYSSILIPDSSYLQKNLPENLSYSLYMPIKAKNH